MDIKLVKDEGGEWLGIYVDGKLIDEGYPLATDWIERTLAAVGAKYEEVEVRDLGRCPENYTEVDAMRNSQALERIEK